jgi:hypothetical protein
MNELILVVDDGLRLCGWRDYLQQVVSRPVGKRCIMLAAARQENPT